MSLSEHRVLAVGAHPDDVEFMCAGLLALLRNAGCQVHIATMSSGDCGSMSEEPETVRRIRQGEAAAACRALGAIYHPLDFSDFYIYNDDNANRRVTALLREIDPSVVITHSPEDYLSDHETTSTLVRNACFYGPVPNYKTSHWTTKAKASSIPHLYYAHPMEGIDIFGDAVVPHLYVDVTSVFPLKAEMLSCHKSQREWLRAQHGMDEYVESMRRWSRTLGQQASAISGGTIEFAEAYRQHRGHAYPHDLVLNTLLGNLVITAPADPPAKNPTPESAA
jgi:LmbE family N-acetylglucosaminyl deacetylase